jgi:hypothetical protein
MKQRKFVAETGEFFGAQRGRERTTKTARSDFYVRRNPIAVVIIFAEWIKASRRLHDQMIAP